MPPYTLPQPPAKARPPRRNRSGRADGTGRFARRNAQRLAYETLAARARFLPTLPQALVTAYYDLGMTVRELAAIHKTSEYRLQRKLLHWRDTLSDPSFLLAAHFSDRLDARLAGLARAHWVEGRTLRELAAARQVTLHEIRVQLADARLQLVRAASQPEWSLAAAAEND